MDGKGTVCVTGATGFVGSWLVMRLLERGYTVKATVRDPDNEKKVKHLVDLPSAKTRLTLWKTDLADEGSFDEAIDGCIGVFHNATPMDIQTEDPENEVIKLAVDGARNVMRSCLRAKSLQKIVFTSSTGAVVMQEHLKVVFDEDCWTDVDFCRKEKMFGWFVHLDDLCQASIFLFEHPKSQGRYICSSHDITLPGLANMLRDMYPEYDIPKEFEGIGKINGHVQISSKKLLDLGFEFKYSLEDMYEGAIQTCRAKGLIPLATKN